MDQPESTRPKFSLGWANCRKPLQHCASETPRVGSLLLLKSLDHTEAHISVRKNRHCHGSPVLFWLHVPVPRLGAFWLSVLCRCCIRLNDVIGSERWRYPQLIKANAVLAPKPFSRTTLYLPARPIDRFGETFVRRNTEYDLPACGSEFILP